MTQILLQNLNLNSRRATRELNKLLSRKAGQVYSTALPRKSNGRFSGGCSILLVAQTALIKLACLRK